MAEINEKSLEDNKPGKMKPGKGIIVHFIIINIVLFAFLGYLQANNLINSGCTVMGDCEGFKTPGYIMFFDFFKTFLIVWMAIRIPLITLENGIFSFKYIIALILFIIVESGLSILSTMMFYELLI